MHATLRIRSVTAIPVALPLKRPVLMGGRVYNSSESLLVRIESDEGTVGWGEACTAPHMTGETLGSMVHAVDEYLSACLLDSPAWDRPWLIQRLSTSLVGNHAAKAACEIALHDLCARQLGVRVADLLGGAARQRVTMVAQLANSRAEDDIEEALVHARLGYEIFKLRVGIKPIAEEINALQRLHQALGPNARFCVDGNTSLTPGYAHQLAMSAEDLPLIFIEQPFAATDFAHTKALATSTHIPLCADESIHDVADLFAWEQASCIGGVNLKTIKLGGLLPTLQAATVSHAMGMHITLASKTAESGIGAAALLHLAHVVPNLEWGLNLTSHYLSDDVVTRPFRPVGHMQLPSAPGLGIEVDEEKVERYRVR